MNVLFLFIHDTPPKFVVITRGFSSRTVARWFKIFMSILIHDFSFLDTKIGGEGIIVECDESKFGKRKYVDAIASNPSVWATKHILCWTLCLPQSLSLFCLKRFVLFRFTCKGINTRGFYLITTRIVIN